MTLFTATAEPNNSPPRIRLDFDTQIVGSVFTQIVVKRNGVPIRSQPPVGSQVSVTYDYDATFGDIQTYTVEAQIAGIGVADWTENWASLASWSGATASWSVAAGVASSLVPSAAIARPATSVIGRVDVTNPVLVRVEVLDITDAVIASVEAGAGTITLGTSSGYSQVNGAGTFQLLLSDGFATATGSGWTVSRPYVGTPTKVRLVALGQGANQTTSWSTTGDPNGIAVHSSGAVYAVDFTNKLVRKFTSAGAAGSPASWSTIGNPSAIAVDSTGNVYVTDVTSNLVRKFTSAGAAGSPASWSTTGQPLGIAVDSSGNIYVLDATNLLVRKYNSAGVAGITFAAGIGAGGIAVDSAGNVYITDLSAKLVRKYSSSGVAGITWSTTGFPKCLTVDSAGNVYVIDNTSKLIRKYNSAGIALGSWSIVGFGNDLDVDSAGNVYVTDSTNKLVRKFAQITTSVGQVVATLASATTPFNALAQESLNSLEAWLMHPINPDLSVKISTYAEGNRRDRIYVEQDSARQIRYDEQREVFAPLGRTRRVPVTYGNRRPGEWTLQLRVPRIEDRDSVLDLLADQSPLLLRIPPSFPWDLVDDWYSVGAVDDERLLDSPTQNIRSMALPLTPVDEPVLAQGAQWTYGDDVIRNETYDDSRLEFATYLDRLVGP